MNRHIMTLWLHLILAALSVIFFVISFIKQKKAYQLVFAIWVLSTLLKYVSSNELFLNILGVVQILFFFLCVFLLFRNKNRTKSPSVFSELKKFDEEMKLDSEKNKMNENNLANDINNKQTIIDEID